ncbi:trypsin domain-containing protein, partial [Mycobacterium rhizamassiliense]
VSFRWLQGAALTVTALMSALVSASPARAAPPPAPGIQMTDEILKCTAGFAAKGNDGSYYLLTSGHCDSHQDSLWKYEQNVPLGKISASEEEGDRKDAAVIRLDRTVGKPVGDVGGRRVRDVWGAAQIQPGTPFCKLGAITGETCGAIKNIDGEVVEASVYALNGDSGSAGFVKNEDGSVSAVGILMGSLTGDDNTTYYVLVQPLLDRWGLRVLP